MRSIYVTLLLVLGLVSRVFGANYYVATTGSDTNGDGSQTKPWHTLRYAVSQVPANQGHVIILSAGVFIESGLVEVPLGVSIEGAGKDVTVLKADPSFYYNPADPGYATDKYLISLNEFNPSNGNQHLKGFTIDGDNKQLHGGIYVKNRSNVLIDSVKVTGTDFNGIWLWDVKYSRITHTDLINCAWGSSGYVVGALNLGNIDHVEIDHCYIDEDTGYGIKAIGPSGYDDWLYSTIHDCTVTVNPTGLWNSGSAPNIAIELWQVDPLFCEIYNCYIDNNISLVNANANPSTGNQTIRVHHNVIDMETRAHGAGYGIEMTMHDMEIDHNYFIKGSYAMANWGNPMENWEIHHNVFYGIQGTYPGEILRSQWGGLHNVNFYNNTIEIEGNKTVDIIGLYGGTSDNVNVKNNLIIDNNTSYSYWPDTFVYTEGGATMTNLTVTNNLFYQLPIGTFPGTYANNLKVNPMITQSGNRPDPYYIPLQGSPLIDAGVNVGYAYEGSAPDIGAYEYPSTVVPNQAPTVSITAPANNATITQGNNVTITANASDSDGTVSKVEFFSGSTKLGEDLTSPYGFTWSNVTAGTYSLTAKATDNDGAVTTSNAISITITAPTNKAPSVNITGPANNATFTQGSNVTITANASDSDGTVSKVEFFSGSTKLGEDLTSPFSFIWNNLSAGTYSLTAKATDNDGAVATSSAISIIVMDTTNQAPSVSITTPAINDSFVEGDSVLITADASDPDGTITKVEFFNGNTKLGEALSAPYRFDWQNLVPGNYTLMVRAYDNQGATAEDQVTITVSQNSEPIANAGPDIMLELPQDSVTLNGVGEDKNGDIVRYSWTQISGPDLPGFSIPMEGNQIQLRNLVVGTYIFVFTVTDQQNLTATDEVKVTVLPPSDVFALQYPRFFTPNDDGVNDYWEWENLDDNQQYALQIFNKNGQVVFETSSYRNDWDGVYHGQKLAAGAYYFIMQTNKGPIRGAVRIIR